MTNILNFFRFATSTILYLSFTAKAATELGNGGDAVLCKSDSNHPTARIVF